MNTCTRVFIVAEVQRGMGILPQEYRTLVEMYRRILEEARDDNGYKLAKIVVGTVEEAEKKLKELNVIVFISRAMEAEAERIARENLLVKVVVFTGLIPEGKVIWVSKLWAADKETIQNIVLHY